MRTLLMLVFWIVLIPLAAAVTLPYAWATGSTRFLYRFSMWIARTGVRLAGVRVEVAGRERLDPHQTYIFMANHVSNLDPPVLMPEIPNRTSVLVKMELFRIPIFGYAMRLAHLVPVDRANRDAAVASVRNAAEVVRAGFSMMVFPEGTRSRDGRLLPLKKGPFYLATESGCPIVPVTILGTYEILPKGKFLVRGELATARLIFHQPIWPQDYPDRDALMDAVSERITSALPPERR
jgi:1-acyl-sn-glycerol-3-phosphate acyltransferase